MNIKEIHAKNILSRSKVSDYAVNPYTGCSHACTYCYARFMKRYTGHREPWGEFVDAKINAPDLLRREITTKKPGRVWVSGVCDPYQPAEETYRITGECLEILIENGWQVTVQTKSSLVLRDIDLFRKTDKIEIGLSVTTGDEGIRRLFEPNASPVQERIRVLEELHHSGIKTFAMIAPMLPGAEKLAGMLTGKADYILIDRMNYRYSDWVYKKYHLEHALTDGFFFQQARELASVFNREGMECRILF